MKYILQIDICTLYIYLFLTWIQRFSPESRFCTGMDWMCLPFCLTFVSGGFTGALRKFWIKTGSMLSCPLTGQVSRWSQPTLLEWPVLHNSDSLTSCMPAYICHEALTRHKKRLETIFQEAVTCEFPLRDLDTLVYIRGECAVIRPLTHICAMSRHHNAIGDC